MAHDGDATTRVESNDETTHDATTCDQLSKHLVGHIGHELVERRVDRATQFGNPFVLKKDGGSYTRAESVEAYEEWLVEKIQTDPAFADSVERLAGKTLGCWCQRVGEHGPACHAEVLAVYAQYLKEESEGT